MPSTPSARAKNAYDAALEAERLRLRPILMTSFAFIFGVLPLALSTGAGARSWIEIGTAVLGGMPTATLLAIFYVPMFFVLLRRIFRGRRAPRSRGWATRRRATPIDGSETKPKQRARRASAQTPLHALSK